jgi:hypothetical protein
MVGVAALVGFLSWHTVGSEITSLTARAPVPRWVATKTVPRLGHSREADTLAPRAWTEDALAMSSMLGTRGRAEPAVMPVTPNDPATRAPARGRRTARYAAR